MSVGYIIGESTMNKPEKISTNRSSLCLEFEKRGLKVPYIDPEIKREKIEPSLLEKPWEWLGGTRYTRGTQMSSRIGFTLSLSNLVCPLPRQLVRISQGQTLLLRTQRGRTNLLPLLCLSPSLFPTASALLRRVSLLNG